ncbi:MAG: hypothetical protein DWQ51_09615 [Microcystis wesenbergii TW10]|uniref:Uncharacterized protein n=1 Tax=Microcystis wesenbergii TW10 TaxID=2060474 RepID=A0A3E0LYW2_9CHRO|nr:MAG: hypothetical protein DWQ51_09615 [Microcystis wesenbergii TW10]
MSEKKLELIFRSKKRQFSSVILTNYRGDNYKIFATRDERGFLPHTPHPTPHTPHPTPYTPHPTPYTLHPLSSQEFQALLPSFLVPVYVL